jgi:gluconolactonase
VFDSNGVLYFSDPKGSSLDRPTGGFYRAFPDGTLEQLDTGLAFPNGVAIAPDGSAVYLAETWTNRILRYTIGAEGRVGPRTEFVHLTDKPGPDGLAFDEAGYLYVAHFNFGRVDVYSPTGRERDRIVVPGAGITNMAFGGRANRDLVITEVTTASVYRTRVDLPGLPLFAASPDNPTR